MRRPTRKRPPPAPAAPGRKPELLAPAGTIEAFFAALEQGADAVYVGTAKFNARLRAANFTMDEVARMVAYAHRINRGVHVTLNTLIKESELAELVDTIDALRHIGPDALIVQDLGTYLLARRLAPELPLHASTQMTIHNVDGALQAHRMGFERVILAREMTIEEIRSVCRGGRIEVETFVHGAMCYSISGQCNFSSYAHGKSANRGCCLQPCRRLYDDGKDRLPIFATLDLGTAPILLQLIAAGIHAFKIEGRLKPAETIAQTVAAYRLLIDAYPTLTKDAVAEARRRLRLAIGRKQSTGFYLSAAPEGGMVGEGASRSGRYLGKALRPGAKSFELQTREIIKIGDRLNVQKTRQEAPRAFNIRRMCVGRKAITRSRPNQSVRIFAPFDVEPGAAVVKLIDADAVTDEAKRHEHKKWPRARTRAKARFDARLWYDASGAVMLETEANGRRVTLETWPSFETHVPAGQARSVLGQVSSGYHIRLDIGECDDFPDGVPMTVHELDALRDEALQALSRVMGEVRAGVLEELTRPLRAGPPDAPKDGERILVRAATLTDAAALVRQQCVDVIVPLSNVARELSSETFDNARLKQALIAELPTFAFECGEQRDTLVSTLKLAIRAGVRSYAVSNLAHFQVLRPYRDSNLRILAGDSLHCLNSSCFEQLRELGATQVVFAQEGDREALAALLEQTGPESIVVTVYGTIPLFRSRQPLPRGIEEVTSVVGKREQLRIFRRRGLTHVLPERDFSLRHLIAELREMGVRHFLYDLTHVPAARIRKAKRIWSGTHVFDPKTETTMNFERGLS